MGESDVYPGEVPRLGLITNPNSRRNRLHLDKVRELVRDRQGLLSREGRDSREVEAAVREMLDSRIGVIAINGGDGTVQAVLSALLMDPPPERLPAIVLLRGGTTNMNADDVGPRGKLLNALERTLRLARSDAARAPSCRRPILRVEANGGAFLKHGMCFGAGAIVNGIEYCHRKVLSKGLRDGLAPVICALRVLYAMATKDSSMTPPVSMKISLSPAPEWSSAGDLEGAQFVILASTLERLFFGLRPYWGEDRGLLHFTAVRARPVRAWRVMPLLFFGRAGPAATPENGYVSGKFESVRINMDGSIALDGEIYPVSGKDGPVRLSVGGWVTFLQP